MPATTTINEMHPPAVSGGGFFFAAASGGGLKLSGLPHLGRSARGVGDRRRLPVCRRPGGRCAPGDPGAARSGAPRRDGDQLREGRQAAPHRRRARSRSGADELRGEVQQPRRLRKIRGSHLVFRADRLPISGAISFLHPRDRRAVFAIPWEGVVIAGTTDVDHEQLSNEPTITEAETDYILESLRRAFPTLELTASDAIATYSGVRPVIDTGKADPSKESREHVVWQENGLVTITGGKLTTFALMARKALAAASGALGPMLARTRVFDANPVGLHWPSSISVDDRFRLLGRFGAEAEAIAADTANAQRIDGSIALWSELRHAARHEAVLTLSDLLLRRVRLGILLPNGGLDQIARIRSLTQRELGWDDAQWEREEADYRSTWKRSYGPIV